MTYNRWSGWLLPATKQGRGLCVKIATIDAKIIRYKRLASQINDKILIEGIAQLIEKVLAEKASLHPEPDKK